MQKYHFLARKSICGNQIYAVPLCLRQGFLIIFFDGTSSLIILAYETLSQKISNYKFVKNINELVFCCQNSNNA